MVDEMLRLGGDWWGHNSGRYDTLQVLEILRRRGVQQSINLAQSRVTRTMGGGLTIRDSYSLVPLGLEALAQMAKRLVPTLWFDCVCADDCGGYCQLRPGLPYYMKQRVDEYCVEDCLALIHGLNALQEFADENDYDLQGTIGGSAWATVRRLYGLPDASYSPQEWDRLRSAYYGGRLQVYRPIVTHSGGHWDIGSAYPAALADAELPVGRMAEYGATAARGAFKGSLPGMYSATVTVPEAFAPILPWRMENDSLAFPYGVVSGAWTQPELQYALDNGCILNAIHWGIVWPKKKRIFEHWIKDIYKLRVSLGKDSAFGQWLRLFPNSLSGKMAERPEKKLVRLHPPIGEVVLCDFKSPCNTDSCVCGSWDPIDKWGEMWAVPFYRLSPSSHIHWASYVTSLARMQLHRALSSHEQHVAYTHTDSVWLGSDAKPTPCGGGLGEWSRKNGFLEFESPAPGAYAFVDEATGEYVVHASGARLRSREWVKGHHEQDRGVMSLLDAARSDDGLFVRAHRKWTLPKHGEWYGDRRMTSGNHTRATTCNELRTRLNERRNQRR